MSSNDEQKQPELIPLFELTGNKIFILKILLNSITKVLENNYINFFCGINKIIIFGKNEGDTELIHLALDPGFFDDYLVEQEFQFAIEPKQLAKILERPSKQQTVLKIGYITKINRFSCIYEDDQEDKNSSFELPIFTYDEENTLQTIDSGLNKPLETFVFLNLGKNSLDLLFEDQKYVVFDKKSAVFELFTQPDLGQITITTARTEVENSRARTELSLSEEGAIMDISGKESKSEYNYSTIYDLNDLNRINFKTIYNYSSSNILKISFNLFDEGYCIFSLLFLPFIDEDEDEDE